MADAFKGLTIRLGADSRPLKTALDSVNRSASQAQTQLRQVEKALKLDAASTELLGDRLALAGDKARLAARSTELIGTALDQARRQALVLNEGGRKVATTLGEAAAKTRDVHAAAQGATAEYNHVNVELQRIDDVMAKILAREKGLSKSEALTAVRKLRSQMSPLGDAANSARSEIERLLAEASRTGLPGAFGILEGDARALTQTYNSLRERHVELTRDLSALGRIKSFQNLERQSHIAGAELKEAAMQAARFRSELYAAGDGPLAQAAERARQLDIQLETASREARELEQASREMPSDYHAAWAKARALANEQEILQEKARVLNDRLKQIEGNPAFDRQRAQTANAVAELNKAEAEYADIAQKIALVEERQERLNAEAREYSRTDFIGPRRGLALVNDEIEKANSELGELRVRERAADEELKSAAMYREWQKTDAALAGVNRRMVETNSAISRFKSASQTFGRLRTFGYGLYSSLTPLLTTIGMYAVQAAEDIDSAYRDMRKTVNGTEEDFERLKDAAIDFSRTHITSADTILEIEALGGQLGIQVSNLESFATAVSSLDIATDIDAEDLATYIGQLSNIMNDMRIHKDDPKEYEKTVTSFSDALVRLGNNTAAQESNIMAVMMRIASMGTISGFTTPELLAIADAVAATGQGAEAAGTAIAKTFSNIESAVGKGGDVLQGFAEVAGMSAEDFAETWNDNAIEAFTSFIGGLKRIDEEGGSVDRTLAGLKINSVRQKQALEGLTQTYDVLTGSLKMANDAWNGQATIMADGSIEKAGDAAREAQRKSEGFSGELGILKNNAKALMNELTDGALPILRKAGDAVEWLSGIVRDMPDWQKTFAIEAGVGLAALAPISIGVGAVGDVMMRVLGTVAKYNKMRVFPQLVEDIAGVAAPGIKSSSALGKLSAKLSGSVGPAARFAKALGGLTMGPLIGGLAIAGTAVGFIVDALKQAKQRTENYKKATDGLAEAVKSGSPVLRVMGDDAGYVSGKFQAAKSDVEGLIETTAEMVGRIEERNRSAQGEINSLQEARGAIRDYMNVSGLSAEQQGRLRAAIDLVNQECGTQYKLVDANNGVIWDETGALVENVDAIGKYIKAKQDQIQLEALEESLADVREQKAEAIRTQAAAYEELVEAQEKYDATEYRNPETGEFEHGFWSETNLANATQAYRSATGLVDSLTDAENSYYEMIGSVASGNTALASSWMDVYEAIFGSYTGFQDFERAVRGTGASLDDLNSVGTEDMIKLVDSWKRGGGEIAELLRGIGVETRTLADAYSEALENSGASFESLAERLGSSTDALAGALSDAGIGFDMLSAVSKEDLQSMADKAEGDLGRFASSISEYTASTRAAEQAAQNLGAAVDEIGDGEINYDDEDLVEAEEQAYDTEEAIESIPESKDITIDVYGNAQTVLQDIINKLQQITSKEITVTTYSSEVKNAAGGINDRIIRAIPRHADGGINGIVTRPTLTNVGLTGEAGDEAIFHMRHAGGAIIPLSNRQHVRPFARAVAAEMGAGGSSTVYNITIDGNTINDDPEIRAVVQDVIRVAGRRAAMNRG